MLRDTWLIFLNEMGHRRRQAMWFVVGLMQPVLYLFCYGPLATALMSAGTGLDTWDVFVPLLLLQVSLTQSMFVGLGLLAEHRMGILERFRIAPIARSSLVLGKLCAVAVSAAALSAVIMVLCKAFFTLTATTADMLACIGLNVLLTVAIAAFSYGFALLSKNEQVLNPVLNAVLLPLLLLSGAILPITADAAPAWLYTLSRFNPLTHVMDAERGVLRGDYLGRPAVAGTAILVVLVLIGLSWTTRVFSREGR